MTSSEVLGIYLETSRDASTRVGSLIRGRDQLIRFIVDEEYIELGPDRPIFSSAYVGINDEEKTINRLRNSLLNKGGHSLPPWFSNLLPEGALRTLIETGMPTGQTSDFEVLKWVGLDLPGAVVVRPEDGREIVVAPQLGDSEPTLGRIRFSLAGIQMKMSMLRRDESLTFPASGEHGDIVAKLPSSKIPYLPEVEYSTMALARSVGIDTPHFELVPVEDVTGLPDNLLEAGNTVLAVDRFDRAPNGIRIHMEDFSQVTGAIGDRKYSAANDETVMKIARVFGGGPAAFLQATRRVAVNILFGNTDAHLKNWSLWYPRPNMGSLSPAYDLVAYCVYDHSDQMALKFRNTRDSTIMDLSRFEHAAKFSEINPDRVKKEVKLVVEKAADTWPTLLRNLPMPHEYADYLITRTRRLALVKEIVAPS